MDIKEIQETPIWRLYEIGQDFHNRTNIYIDTDKNYRFYNGNQWYEARLGDVEPVQKNFIKPIVKYKLAVIHDNLYAVHYSSQNNENREFQKQAEKYCDMLNRFAQRIWEQDQMDKKGRKVTKDSAINDEGIMYVDFDKENMMPKNQIIKKVDVYYGDENEEEIQDQPYILIRRRMTESNAKEFARSLGMSEEKLAFIIKDNDTFNQSGEASKIEVEDRVTILYKFYKMNGTVHYSVATRLITIIEDVNLELKLYPIAHFNWEEKEGSARGEGEVRYLIPNQIEVNKTEIRRAIAIKTQAFPQKVIDGTKIANKGQLNVTGAVIETNGQTVDDVHKVVGVIQPAQMSPDVVKFQEDLIQITRELAGAGDIATGNINPEDASGRAILAVQQANQSPMTEQKESYKAFLEDLSRIWLDYLIVHAVNGIQMELEVPGMNGETEIQVVTVPQEVLEQLKAVVKIDVTPKSVYDRFAQEQTIENLLLQGFFNAQRLSELKAYAKSLDDDAVAPKTKILEIVEYMEAEQMKIAMIQAQAQEMKQRASQFINSGMDVQAQQMADAMQQQVPMEQEMPEEEMGDM